MLPVALATTVADTQGHLTGKAGHLAPVLAEVFRSVTVEATDGTAAGVLGALEASGAAIETAPSDFDRIGWFRRRAVERAGGRDGGASVLYADLDHVLRWVEDDRSGLEAVAGRWAQTDCLVVGRTPEAFARLPRRLHDTESVINHVYGLLTGRQWDLLMAVRLLSPRAVEVVTTRSVVDTFANDVEWPLLCERQGLDVDYVEAPGLRYQTDRQYAEGHEADGADEHDTDAAAWVLRMKMVGQAAAAIEPYLTAAARR